MGALGDPRVVSHWLSCFEAASSQFAVEDRSIPDVRETMGHRLRPRAVVPGAISCTEYRVCQRARSVSRVLYRSTPKRRPVMAIHLRPPVARRLMRPTRGLGSAPLPRPVARHGLRPPIWPCSGWSLPVSLRHRPEGRRRHRHCGTGPRLATDGCYPPPCAVELGLSSRHRCGSPRSVSRDHPTGSLTGRFYDGRGLRPAEATRWHRTGVDAGLDVRQRLHGGAALHVPGLDQSDVRHV